MKLPQFLVNALFKLVGQKISIDTKERQLRRQIERDKETQKALAPIRDTQKALKKIHLTFLSLVSFQDPKNEFTLFLEEKAKNCGVMRIIENQGNYKNVFAIINMVPDHSLPQRLILKVPLGRFPFQGDIMEKQYVPQLSKAAIHVGVYTQILFDFENCLDFNEYWVDKPHEFELLQKLTRPWDLMYHIRKANPTE